MDRLVTIAIDVVPVLRALFCDGAITLAHIISLVDEQGSGVRESSTSRQISIACSVWNIATRGACATESQESARRHERARSGTCIVLFAFRRNKRGQQE